nr:MAG TPA: hypothetical protein [Caudoviricetes sp.]
MVLKIICYIISFYCLCILCIQVLRLQHRQKQLNKRFPLLLFLSTYIYHRYNNYIIYNK